MFTALRRFVALGAAALLVTGVLASSSQAAYYRGGYYPPGAMGSPYTYINPVYAYWANQQAYYIRTVGRAYSYVPPYALGYNPYPAYVNYGPVYSSYYNPYYGAYYNPYGYYNPYLYYYP